MIAGFTTNTPWHLATKPSTNNPQLQKPVFAPAAAKPPYKAPAVGAPTTAASSASLVAKKSGTPDDRAKGFAGS